MTYRNLSFFSDFTFCSFSDFYLFSLEKCIIHISLEMGIKAPELKHANSDWQCSQNSHRKRWLRITHTSLGIPSVASNFLQGSSSITITIDIYDFAIVLNIFYRCVECCGAAHQGADCSSGDQWPESPQGELQQNLCEFTGHSFLLYPSEPFAGCKMDSNLFCACTKQRSGEHALKCIHNVAQEPTQKHSNVLENMKVTQDFQEKTPGGAGKPEPTSPGSTLLGTNWAG